MEYKDTGEAFVSSLLSENSDDDLIHSGVKGMKWGVRRYQNKDGSLTPAGKKRYGSAPDFVKKAREAVKGAHAKRKAAKAAEKESERIQKLMKKPINKLTESELAERTALARKQKELRQIESDSNRLAENGRAFASKLGNKFLNDAVIPGLVNAGRGVIEKFVTKKVSDALGLGEKDVGNALDALKKVGGDYTKLTDKQAKDIAEFEKNINSAKQQRTQRERAGNDDNSDSKPNNESASKSNTANTNKNKSDSKSNNTNTNKDKSDSNSSGNVSPHTAKGEVVNEPVNRHQSSFSSTYKSQQWTNAGKSYVNNSIKTRHLANEPANVTVPDLTKEQVDILFRRNR